ncbi:MAG: BLUF domain-containing protein [Fuerstiella sp.]
MIRIYYISTAAEGLTSLDYEDILSKARKNNQELELSGLLVVKGGLFAQAIEGREERVSALFEKIKLDKRHHRIVLISKTEIEERLFPNWEMGFKDIDVSESQLEIDLADPKFVKQPELLDRVFRHVVNQEFVTQ